MLRKIESLRYFLRMYRLYRETHRYSMRHALKRAKELTSAHAKYS